MYLDRLHETRPSDYAAFFWLAPLLPGLRSVFDFGGNLGWSYYSFQNYLSFPYGLAGRSATSRSSRRPARSSPASGSAHLSFATDFADGDGCDLLLTCGTLQYLDRGLAEAARPLPQ